MNESTKKNFGLYKLHKATRDGANVITLC